ncbi:hypothetical protein Airi02_102600 [Actinoallomurus iriomotensis]|uniref:Uncharacterized protein n=1 Tax=Actinoallomurus iriomotensis TaxID=478107 RepID=A0A9W6W6T2_9ACTN|nr:hypothetical protein Airi02_102600 [Actinoallomurus iriomotensis]
MKPDPVCWSAGSERRPILALGLAYVDPPDLLPGVGTSTPDAQQMVIPVAPTVVQLRSAVKRPKRGRPAQGPAEAQARPDATRPAVEWGSLVTGLVRPMAVVVPLVVGKHMP